MGVVCMAETAVLPRYPIYLFASGAAPFTLETCVEMTCHLWTAACKHAHGISILSFPAMAAEEGLYSK